MLKNNTPLDITHTLTPDIVHPGTTHRDITPTPWILPTRASPTQTFVPH